jgi:hypothetical protein
VTRQNLHTAERSAQAFDARVLVSSAATALPSGLIRAFKVMRMCTVFGSSSRAVLGVHTSSHLLTSSPSIGARAIIPSMNSSGMPRSVRIGMPSASRP